MTETKRSAMLKTKKGTMPETEKSAALETAIYVRVSTEEQAQEGFSIRAQEQKLKDY